MLKKILTKPADIIKNDPRIIVLGFLGGIIFFILPNNITESYKSKAFNFLGSLPNYLPMNILLGITFTITFIYILVLLRANIKNEKNVKALQERTEYIEKALQERTESIEKALQERTEALEADLYRQVFLHGLLKKYVIEQLPQETKSLDDMGYTEAQVRFLFDYESKGSNHIHTAKEHQLHKTKPLEISKREGLEKKFIDIHWANIQKY